jgi:2-isopropylmalate synthase
VPRRIAILDTTLRDGEQAPGFSMNLEEKLEVARQLARLGVDVIEAGCPVSSPGDFESVREIARVVRGPVIASLARANDKEIDAAWEALRPAERPRIHVVLATSPIHMEHRLHMSADQVLELARASVKRARGHCPDVEFSAEDATRSDPGFLCAVLQAAIEAGATVVNLPDTVGYAVPGEYAALVATVLAGVPDIGKATLSAHCHDDLGLAVANTLAAIGAGAQQVECTINGLGERAGNAALEELVMVLATRSEYLGAYCDVETAQIYASSKLVQAVTGVRPQPNKAIVGDNAFAHESSGHQAGVLESRSTYEIMTPESVGRPTSRMVLGKHSGRGAFEERLAFLGLRPRPDAMGSLFERFKELADRKKTVTDRDLEALVLGASATAPGTYRLDRFVINSGSSIAATSAVRLAMMEGGPDERAAPVERATLIERVAVGDGPIDASFKAIEKIVGKHPVLEDFALNAVTEGKDAQGEARVRILYGNKRYNGRGLSTDVVEASIKAYIAAINVMAQESEDAREPDNGT